MQVWDKEHMLYIVASWVAILAIKFHHDKNMTSKSPASIAVGEEATQQNALWYSGINRHAGEWQKN